MAKKTDYKKFTTVMLILTGLMFLIAIAVYAYNFWNHPISEDPERWGNFGDYLGGVINPLVTIVNLFVLVFITYQVAESDEQRSQRDLENQRKFTLYSLQHDSIKDLGRILESVQDHFVDVNKKSEVNVMLIRNEFKAHIVTTSYLFPNLDENAHDDLVEALTRLAGLVGQYYMSLNVKEDPDPKIRETNHAAHLACVEQINEEVKLYSELKVVYITQVQQQIQLKV